MFAQLVQWLKPSPLLEPSHRVYIALVSQSRQPFFYSDLGVPDTLDGRFDMILVHLFVMIERLRADESPACEELSQHITDAFVSDMDRCLREMGIGDTGVAKRVKKMADALNGRMTAYREGLSDSVALGAALTRNLYGTTTPAPDHVNRMAAYITSATAQLKTQPTEIILSGQILWPCA